MKDKTEISKTPLYVAQITDTHLYADPRGQLMGLDTRHALKQVVNLALSTHAPDLVIASGDLAHDGSPQAYQHLHTCFSRLGVPIYCLPGNHDEAVALRANADCGRLHSSRSACAGGWLLVFLDSTVSGSEGGHLAESELDELDTVLASHPGVPALVCLHHQPVNVGSRWLDTMAVDNPKAFFDIIDKHRQVRAVIWGHVHQTFEQQRNGVRLLATPSTCVQFLPNSEEFALDIIPPGYRWLKLYPDGTFQTGVERLQAIPGKIDLGARGY
jgi:Icc protein